MSNEVVCIETGERFRSQREAARSYGFAPSSMSQAILKECSIKGLHFYYADKPLPTSKFFKRMLRVRCIETGVVYNSLQEASEDTGVPRKIIWHAVCEDAKGLHWERGEWDSPKRLLRLL